MFNKLGRIYGKYGKNLRLYWRVFSNPRTPTATKILFIAALGYLVSPIDVLPDIAIPFAGHLDDLIVLPVLFWIGMKFVPKDVLKEATALRQG